MDSTGVRHLISLQGAGRDVIDWIVRQTLSQASGTAAQHSLADKIVGLYFTLTSTRTRTAFAAAAMRLGASVISYGPGDLQLNTGETLSDTARVLSGMLDALVIRSARPSGELASLASQAEMAVVNGMSLDEHPTQALADLATMSQQFGGIDGIRVLYLGEGNSTATALTLALSRYDGTELDLRTPPGYGVRSAVLAAVAGERRPGRIRQRHDLDDLPDEVDVIYTTQWVTTGTAKRTEDWRELFTPFRVDQKLLDRYPSAVFMHDLPAHRGDEVEAEVIDGPRSIVFRQAATKLHGAMAVLEWCLL